MEGWEEIEYLRGEDMCKGKVGGEERFAKEKNSYRGGNICVKEGQMDGVWFVCYEY